MRCLVLPFLAVAAWNWGSSAVLGQSPELVFRDGFESGTALVWSSPCLAGLNARAVDFEIRPWTPPTSPLGQTCEVEEPVWLDGTVHGVDLVYHSDVGPSEVFLSCAGATALVDTAADLAALDITEIQHLGTFNCREIAGTTTLSDHALGNAIDFSGFRRADESLLIIEDDWEIGTSPTTPDGIFLWNAVNRWFDAGIWTIILTPNYSDAHRNHFHCVAKEGASYLNRGLHELTDLFP